MSTEITDEEIRVESKRAAASAVSLVGVVKRRFEVKPSKVDGILNYDIDNAYPQRVMYTIASSGTGVACVNLLSDYITGRGFADDTLTGVKLNRSGETPEAILQKISKDKAKFRGWALHINWGIDFKISEINFVPFEHCRHCVPDDTGFVSKIAVYNNWDKQLSKKIDSKQIDKIHVWNPNPEVIAKQIVEAKGIENYKGQIFWFSEDGTEYPLASCDAVMQDLESDSLVSTFTWRTLKTGFIQQNAFVYRGKFENDTQRQSFKGNLNTFQGADNSNQMLLIESESEASDPKIINIPVMVNDKLFESTDNKVTMKIVKNYRQPLALHSVQQPGTLGLTREFEEAQHVYDIHTDKHRTQVSQQLAKILPFWRTPLTSNLTIIPMGGLRKDADKVPLATTLGVGGIQALQSILSDATIQPPQKVNILITVFGIQKTDAEAMVLGTPVAP